MVRYRTLIYNRRAKQMENLETMAYYAQCKKTKNLHVFYWKPNDSLLIKSPQGDYVKVDKDDYEIVQIAMVVSE